MLGQDIFIFIITPLLHGLIYDNTTRPPTNTLKSDV